MKYEFFKKFIHPFLMVLIVAFIVSGVNTYVNFGIHFSKWMRTYAINTIVGYPATIVFSPIVRKLERLFCYKLLAKNSFK